MDERILGEIDDGRRADRVLEGISPYLEEIRESLWEAFKKSSATDASGLQAIRMQLGAVDALEANIQSVIDTGRMAEIEEHNSSEH